MPSFSSDIKRWELLRLFRANSRVLRGCHWDDKIKYIDDIIEANKDNVRKTRYWKLRWQWLKDDIAKEQTDIYMNNKINDLKDLA